MGYTRYYYEHQDRLDGLAVRFPAFQSLRHELAHGRWHTWNDTGTGIRSKSRMIVFIGQTGQGKSSTVNAISGDNMMATSDVEACTRESLSLDFEITSGHYLTLTDLPGVGENQQRDSEYLDMYRFFLDLAEVVVYVLRVDARDFAIDLAVLKQLRNSIPDLDSRLLLVIGQCDKAAPLNRGRFIKPTPEQHNTIQRKIGDIERIFKPKYPVLPYSAACVWNMDKLTSGIIDVIRRNSA